MAQRSDRRSNNTNIGCIWGLVNMFNFRRESSKLLPERRHRNRKRLGSWYSSRTRLLTEPEKKHEDLECGQEATNSRQSIKKLMENEMPDVKQAQIFNAEGDQKHCYNKNKSNSRPHQNSDLIHAMRSSNLSDESVSELVQRISTNIVSVLEEGSSKKKDTKSFPSSGRDSHSENANAEAYHIGQDEMNFLQDHLILQILESLICDDLTLAKYIISQSSSSQSQLRKLLEILSSNKDLLLRILQDAKPNIFRDIQDQQGRSSIKTGEQQQSSKDQIECYVSDYRLSDPRKSEDLGIHAPLLRDREVSSSLSRSKIVILKPHNPSSPGNFPCAPEQTSLNASNKMELNGKERSAAPVFFQDIKRRLRLLLGDGKRDRRLVEIDGGSSSSEQELQTSAGSTRVGTSLALIEPNTNNELEVASKASDADPLGTGDDVIFPRKPKIDFVDVLDYGDDDRKLTFAVSKSSKNLVLLPEHSQSASQDSTVKDVKLNCTNQDTDVNFFRSSILNLETSTGSSGATSQMLFNWSSGGCPDAQPKNSTPCPEKSTPKGDKEVGIVGITNRASIPRNDVSKLESDASSSSSAEFVPGDLQSKLDLHFMKPPQPEMHMEPTDYYSKGLGAHGSSESNRSGPVSILEPMLLERFVSTGNTVAKINAKNAMSPRRLSFEEDNLSESRRMATAFVDTQMTTCADDDKFKYEYLRSLLQASGLCNGDVCEKVECSDQLLDPSLYDEVETPCEEIPDDLRVFFDSVNEVLVEIFEKSSSPIPWVSFYRPSVRPFPYQEENLVKEAWHGLKCVFVPRLATSLDEIVERDFESKSWMDIRWGAEETGFDFSDAILETLLEETMHELYELVLPSPPLHKER